MGIRALIGLGSNLGDRRAILDVAVAALVETRGVEVRVVSAYHETAPVGGPPGQEPFLNAAIAIETTLPPHVLHARLLEIEREAGRVRVVRWGERTLDLDLLLFGSESLDGPELIIPHPRMAVRRFVLSPMAQIAADAIHPPTRATVRDLLANLDRRPGMVVLVGPDSRAIFGPLVASLNAAGLLEETGSPQSYAYQTDFLRDEPPDYSSILRQRAKEWDVERWSARDWGDRWIVSDFWFDGMQGDASFLDRVWDVASPQSKYESWRQEFTEARSRVLRPTFLAPTVAYSHRQLISRFERTPDAFGREVPILPPPSIDPGDGSVKNTSHPSPARVARVVAEVVAACAASRSGTGNV